MTTLIKALLEGKSKNIHSVSPDTNVFECARKMADTHVHALLVIENGKLKGILSDRDILEKVVIASLDPKEISAQQIMTFKMLTVTLSMTVYDAMVIMNDHRIRHLPVLENGNLVGIISIGDVMHNVLIKLNEDISSLRSYIQGG